MTPWTGILSLTIRLVFDYSNRKLSVKVIEYEGRMLVTGYLSKTTEERPAMHHNKHARWTWSEEDMLINNFGGKYGWTVREAAFRLRRSYGGTRYHIRMMGLEIDGDDWRIEPGCEVAMWRMGEGKAELEQAA